jgi:hypothetical protein
VHPEQGLLQEIAREIVAASEPPEEALEARSNEREHGSKRCVVTFRVAIHGPIASVELRALVGGAFL